MESSSSLSSSSTLSNCTAVVSKEKMGGWELSVVVGLLQAYVVSVIGTEWGSCIDVVNVIIRKYLYI